MRRIFRLTNLPTAISLAVVGIIWTLVEAQNRSEHQLAIRQEVLGSASVVRAHIEGTVSSNIQLVRGLIATLKTEPDMNFARFTTLAAGLMDQNSIIRNLVAAPDMVIRYVYPLEGNEAVLGLNYLENDLQRDDAVLARDTGALVLAGPIDLVQGGVGFISRFPVFVDNGTNDDQFWGLVSVVIDADRFYAVSGLNDDSLEIQVALSEHGAGRAQRRVFFGDAAILDRDPVQMPITLPFGNWDIAAIPQGGWQNTPQNLWTLRIWLFLGAALIVIPNLVMGRLLDERASNVKRLHFALQRRGEVNGRYQSVARVSRTFVWEQDADHRLTYLSGSYHHITGRLRQDVLGQRLSELARNCADDRSDITWATLEEHLSKRETFNDILCLAVTDNGSEIWLQLSGSPVFDDHGAFLGYQGAGMDVTTVQRARQAADASSRAKSIFLANMSHEIRTPLNGVLGMAEVLESMNNDPEQLTMITTIRESGQSLHNILNDILDLSKIDAKKLELETVPFQPETAIQRILDLHRLRAEEKGLKLNLASFTQLGPARMGDAHRFAQILHNLVGNSVKFTEHGEVSISITNVCGEPITVRISDTGPGMSQDEQQRLFDPFVQGDGSIARLHGGTGLGMSIVHQLVNLMQGDIEVHSVLREGTSISITLPLTEQKLVPTLRTEKSLSHNLTGLRLLAADDNATNRLVLETMLRGTGVELTLVEDGQQAIDAWDNAEFDILLLDISMPVVGGIEAFRQIALTASQTGRPLPPAIAFTANVMSHQITEYLNEGFVSYVGKPLNRKILFEALAAARP